MHYASDYDPDFNSNTKRNYQLKELLEAFLASMVLSKPTLQNLVHVLLVKSILRLNILNLVL